MFSFWEKESLLAPTDVLIIGSGIVGLSTALHLKEKHPSLSVRVVERGALPWGASSRNAGFACFGSISELLEDMETRSESEVFALVEKRFEGLKRLRKRLGDTALRYEPLGGYEVFTDSQLFQSCQAQIAPFNTLLKERLGIDDCYKIVDGKIADFGLKGVKHLILNQAEGQIHSGEMMKNFLLLAKNLGIEILNGLKIESIAGNEVRTEYGSLKAKKIVVCTNGFAAQLLPNLEVMPARNQVLVTQPIPALKLKGAFHYEMGYYYFRNIGNRILLGGGRHLDKQGESTAEFGFTEQIQTAQEKLLREMILPYTDFQIESKWSGIMGVGNEKKPIIEWVSEEVLVAVRMGGMGVAIGSLVGEDAAEQVLQHL